MNCVMIKRSQDPLMTHYYIQDIFGKFVYIQNSLTDLNRSPATSEIN